MRRAALVLASLLLASAGCGLVDESPLPWPIDPDAVTDAEPMIIEPPMAAAGEIVEISFRQEWPRGVRYALDGLENGGWRRLAYLLSDANGGSPQSFPVGSTEDMFVEYVGIGGFGPDRVELPAEAPTGTYRICTAMGAENLCAPFEVVAP